MNILGLDLGSKMGWCLLSEKGISWGEENWLKLPRDERVIRFGEFLQDKLPLVDVVCFEEVQTSFGAGSWVIFRQEGVLRYVARDLPFFGVNPSTLKSFAVPGRKGTKALMMDAAKIFLRNRGIDAELRDNEADALCLCFWALKNVRQG